MSCTKSENNPQYCYDGIGNVYVYGAQSAGSIGYVEDGVMYDLSGNKLGTLNESETEKVQVAEVGGSPLFIYILIALGTVALLTAIYYILKFNKLINF